MATRITLAGLNRSFPCTVDGVNGLRPAQVPAVEVLRGSSSDFEAMIHATINGFNSLGLVVKSCKYVFAACSGYVSH
jgi:hypothetical protein